MGYWVNVASRSHLGAVDDKVVRSTSCNMVLVRGSIVFLTLLRVVTLMVVVVVAVSVVILIRIIASSSVASEGTMWQDSNEPCCVPSAS